MSWLSCSGLTKSFGFAPVLRGVDLAAERGERIALVGENGAGKSTLLRVLALLHRPDGGSYLLGERDALKQSNTARAQIGYLGHESGLDRALTTRSEELVAQGAAAPVPTGDGATTVMVEGAAGGTVGGIVGGTAGVGCRFGGSCFFSSISPPDRSMWIPMSSPTSHWWWSRRSLLGW